MTSSPSGIEVTFALPEDQSLVVVPYSEGLCAGDAIRLSGIAALFPQHAIESMQIAIWGRIARRSDVLQAGDRIEILRPLLIDPRIARRERANLGQTMDPASARRQQGESKI